jgi:ferredoxin-NADP reductase
VGRAKRNPRSLLREKTRSYSLVGECDADGYRIAARRAEDSRGGSRYMWSLAPGARLNITQPASLLSIDWTRRHYRLVAGGIGITPIVGAAQALARRDAAFTLHYAVRSREDAAYLDLLAGLLGDRLKVHAGDEGTASISTPSLPRCPEIRWHCSAVRCGCWTLRAMPGVQQVGRSPTCATRRLARAD